MRKILRIIQLALFMSLSLTAQVAKTVYCIPGGLYASITKSEILTVTDLTITGSIDARDFAIMRDSMVVLSSVDISTVSIMAYTGTEGTTGFGVYPVNAIPDAAFYYIPSSGLGKKSLKSFIFPTTITTIRENAFRGTGLTSIAIPSLVTTIGDFAFSSCPGLRSINIPSSVTSIGRYSFSDCTGSTSISISSLLNTIGDYAFVDSSGLITVEPGNPNYSSLDGLLYNNTKTQLINCPISKSGSLIIPSSVDFIGIYAFYGCTALTSVIIPSSVNIINDAAFEYCTGLTSVNIPPSVKTIGTSAFQMCSGLTSVIIPTSVISIGTFSFYGCTSLTSIYANSISPVDLTSKIDVFYGVDKSTCTLYVPTGSKSVYQTANKWQDFVNISELITDFPTPNNENIKIYPNPVTDNFCVSGVVGAAALTVSDLNGKIKISRKFKGYEKIAADNLPRGLYMVKIILNAGVSEIKIIK